MWRSWRWLLGTWAARRGRKSARAAAWLWLGSRTGTPTPWWSTCSHSAPLASYSSYWQQQSLGWKMAAARCWKFAVFNGLFSSQLKTLRSSSLALGSWCLRCWVWRKVLAWWPSFWWPVGGTTSSTLQKSCSLDSLCSQLMPSSLHRIGDWSLITSLS